MTERGDYSINYVPCLFESPFKKILKGCLIEKQWPCAVIWIILGFIAIISFMLGLKYYNASINWFTTLYFVGGLGWVPASMCCLSRAYYMMCQRIYPYLEESYELLVKRYESTAISIFGYLKSSFNVCLSILIWVCMLITIIINNATFKGEYSTAAPFIYIFYIFVAIVFTSVPCAVLHFILTLFKLRKLKLKKHALYQGAGECLQKNRTSCAYLIIGISGLLLLLAYAMYKSPYSKALWIWLPLFGFVPLALFKMNSSLTSTLIHTALNEENVGLQKQLNTILADSSIEREPILFYVLLGIQDKLRAYAESRSSLASYFTLFFTILGGVGSVVAAIFSVPTGEIVIQRMIDFIFMR